MKIDICLPIKNEQEIIVNNVQAIVEYLNSCDLDVSWVITGVINASSDRSYEIFKSLEKTYPKNLKTIKLDKPGKGRAIKEAWNRSESDILIFMDIDLAVPLSYLSKLVKVFLTNSADLVIASRFLPASSSKRTWLRKIISYTYVFLSRLILNHKQTDVQCGFKAIVRDKYKIIEPNLIDNYWFLDTELIIFSKIENLRIIEIPVTWNDRKNKKKKSNINIIKDSARFISNLIKLRRRLLKIKKGLKKDLV